MPAPSPRPSVIVSGILENNETDPQNPTKQQKQPSNTGSVPAMRNGDQPKWLVLSAHTPAPPCPGHLTPQVVTAAGNWFVTRAVIRDPRPGFHLA